MITWRYYFSCGNFAYQNIIRRKICMNCLKITSQIIMTMYSIERNALFLILAMNYLSDKLFGRTSDVTVKKRYFLYYFLVSFRRIFIVSSKRLNIIYNSTSLLNFTLVCCLNESWYLSVPITRVILKELLQWLTPLSLDWHEFLQIDGTWETTNALIRGAARRSSQRGKRYFIDSETRYIPFRHSSGNLQQQFPFLDIDYKLTRFNSVSPFAAVDTLQSVP